MSRYRGAAEIVRGTPAAHIYKDTRKKPRNLIGMLSGFPNSTSIERGALAMSTNEDNVASPAETWMAEMVSEADG